MSSLFEALRNFRLYKYTPPPPPRQPSEYKKGIFLSHRFTEVKQDHLLSVSSQSSSSRSPIRKDDVKKIIGKARLDSQEFGRFTFYLIKWKSKSWEKSTWHHPQHLQNAVGRIMPFNVNIKDKPLPYFDPKYMSAEPKYQQILQDFVLKFLQTKRTQKQNPQSIRPEDQDFDKESEKSSKKSKKRSKLIKKQINHERSRDTKITITQRFRQEMKKIQVKPYKKERNNRNDRDSQSIGNHQSDKKNRQQRQKRHDKYNKNQKQHKYDRQHLQGKDEKMNRKSLWTRDYHRQQEYHHHQERTKYQQKTSFNSKKQQTANKEHKNKKNSQEDYKDKIDETIDKAIRQSFYSKISKSSRTFSNKITGEQQIQLGEVLDSPQFSKDSESSLQNEFITPKQDQIIYNLEQQDTQDLVYLSDTYKSEEIEIKSQVKSSIESKKSIQFVEIEPVKLQYQSQNQLESGEMDLDQLKLSYYCNEQVQQGELPGFYQMSFKMSLN